MRRLRGELLTATIVAAVSIIVHSRPALAAGQPQAKDSSSPVDYMEWPLPAADKVYGAIDGKHLLGFVEDQVSISRRYRDQGHPQFWGRIMGTSGDAESAQWLLGQFNKLGMTETHIQPIDLLPQWYSKSWEVTATGGGKTLSIESAQPSYRSPGTQNQVLDMEVVYVGFGTEAEYGGRDVKGKAVMVFVTGPSLSADQTEALKRAENKGAAALFVVNKMPGTFKFQSYPLNTNVPTFNLVLKDGQAIRTLIEQVPPGQEPHVKIRLEVEMVPNLKTALVWGTLPGATDETIYVIAHRDGWFDAASDNAAGVASMLGLAEYYSRIPKAQRRRTMVFIGWDGHHNTGPGGAAGAAWIAEHRDEFFKKTALIINDEHPANVATFLNGDHSATASVLGRADTYFPDEWYAGGASRPELEKITLSALQEFGVTIWDQPSPVPPAGDMGGFYKFLPGVVVQANRFFYFHTDANTPDTVPWTGLEAVTRSYAKIIDQVNKLDLKDLQRPEDTSNSGR